MTKSILALLIFLAVALSMTQTVWAQGRIPVDNVPPTDYENTNTAIVTASSPSSGKMTVCLLCSGKTGTTYISATIRIESLINGNWIEGTMNGGQTSLICSTDGATLNETRTVSVCPGTYRASVTFRVKRNGSTEVFMVRSTSITVL